MEQQYGNLANVFKVLAHPVRLQILDLLRGGEICVCQIEAALDRRQAYISQQLMVLREAGLVETRKDGLQVFYCIASPTVEALLASALGSELPLPPLIRCATPDYGAPAFAVQEAAIKENIR